MQIAVLLMTIALKTVETKLSENCHFVAKGKCNDGPNLSGIISQLIEHKM